MSGIRWERWAPASGIVYVVLVVVSLFLPGETGDSHEEVLDFYADSGNRALTIVAYFLIAIAVLFFLWFLTTLRARLRAVESEPNSLSTLVFGAGVASATLLLAGVALFVGLAITIEDYDEFVLDPNVARLVEDSGFLLFVVSSMVAGLVVLATSILAIRTAVLPKWLGWLGLVVALAQLVAIFFFPVFAFWAWVLVVSVVLLLRPPTAQTNEPGTRTAQ